MPTKAPVDSNLLKKLHDHTVLLKHNSPAPRGGKYGWLTEGSELTLYSDVVIEQNVGLYGGPYKPMVGGRRSSGFTSVGSFTYSYSALPDGMTVGRYCSISTDLRFIDSSHPLDLLSTSAMTFRPQNHLFAEFTTDAILAHSRRYSTLGRSYPRVGHDVWIGSNVTLSMGIEIGTGAVVASNSTVTKDVPPYAIIGGNPAKLIRFRFPDSIITNLLESQWWVYDPRHVFETLDSDFSDMLTKIRKGRLDKYHFRQVRLL